MQFKHMEQQQEEFRPVPGYEGYYEVSNFGNVKSLTNDKILKPCLDSNGYYKVTLSKDGKTKTIRIHILVATAFLDHVPDGYKIVVDHIDNNKLNNNLTNLQLITHRENISKDRKNGTSQYKGVFWGKNSNKWKSQITINGKQKHLGLFTSEEEAHEVYQNALKIYHDGGDLSFMETRIPTSQYSGVTRHKNSNKWVSRITINNKYKHLGLFTSEEDAAEVYQNALKIYHDGGDLSFMETRIPTSQYKGVSWNKYGDNWRSYIKINGKNKYLGSFTSEEDAAEVYQNALKMYHEGDLSFMETRIPTSQYKGVFWDKNSNKWKSQIKINGKKKYLGYFTSEEDAAEVYQNALKMYNEGDLSFMETRIPSSQYKGVSWNKNANKWMSCIKINGKNKNLGLFTSEEQAYDAYQKALKEKMNTNSNI